MCNFETLMWKSGPKLWRISDPATLTPRGGEDIKVTQLLPTRMYPKGGPGLQ